MSIKCLSEQICHVHVAVVSQELSECIVCMVSASGLLHPHVRQCLLQTPVLYLT